MNDEPELWYHAKCLDPGCGRLHSSKVYEQRADWVGNHRIHTGHSVRQWEGTWEDRDG